MAHKHSVYDTDPHFAIDPITRAITNQSTTKTQLMQYDHNSERFTFEIPRLVDGHDMKLCDKIEIHYINVDAATKQSNADVYEPDDMQLSPESDDVVIFSWLISGNATKYAGTLNFIIRFLCHTGTTIDYAWGTDMHKGISVGGSYSNGGAVIADHTDVLEAWRNETMQRFADFVPLLKVLDAREEAETGRPWFTQPQNAYPRVYTESTATKAPYNKHFLTDRPVAPVAPNGRLAVYGKGVYFTKMDEVRNAAELNANNAVKVSSTDSGYVGFSVQTDDEGLKWLDIHKTETGGNRDREVWMYPTTSNNSLGDGKKVIIEFDMKMQSWSQLTGVTYDKGWTFKVAPLFDGNRAIITSAANNSSLLIYVEPMAIRVRVNNVTERTYKLDPSGIFNFKLALFNKKYYLYINDYLMGVGDSVLNTDTSSVFSRMGLFLNARDSVKFSIANLFCGIVEGENELSGRYLGSIPVRRQNRHILVPGQLSDYEACKLEGLDPNEYALSYGAAQEMLANAGGGSSSGKQYRHRLLIDNSPEASMFSMVYVTFVNSSANPITTWAEVVANRNAINNTLALPGSYTTDPYSMDDEGWFTNLDVVCVSIPEDGSYKMHYLDVARRMITDTRDAFEVENYTWLEDQVIEV